MSRRRNGSLCSRSSGPESSGRKSGRRSTRASGASGRDVASVAGPDGPDAFSDGARATGASVTGLVRGAAIARPTARPAAIAADKAMRGRDRIVPMSRATPSPRRHVVSRRRAGVSACTRLASSNASRPAPTARTRAPVAGLGICPARSRSSSSVMPLPPPSGCAGGGAPHAHGSRSLPSRTSSPKPPGHGSDPRRRRG